jgi:hypothetical protein
MDLNNLAESKGTAENMETPRFVTVTYAVATITKILNGWFTPL